MDNIILEHLRAIRETLDNHTQDFLEVKQRLGFLENQYASISNRLDRLDERVSRIERRLELQDA
jgi:archaellum component FlaC